MSMEDQVLAIQANLNLVNTNLENLKAASVDLTPVLTALTSVSDKMDQVLAQFAATVAPATSTEETAPATSTDEGTKETASV